MKILVVSRLFHPCHDAIGKELSEIFKNCAAQGAVVDVLCMHVKGQQKNERWNNITINRLQIGKWSNYKNYFWEFILFILRARLWLIGNRNKFDIIYVDTMWPTGFALLGFKTKSKIIFQSNGKDMPGYDQTLKLYYKIVSPVLKKLIVNSYGLILHSVGQEKLARLIFSQNKIVFIPNGNDAEIFQYASQQLGEKKNQILYLGRLESVKGIFVFLEAIEILKKSNSFPEDWKFIIAGVGSAEKTILEFCKKNESVKFAGYKTGVEKWKLLEESAIFVLPSLSESGPRTIAEAMAAGCAVVSTRVGDVETKLNNSAVYVETADANSLANGIKKTVSDPELCKKLKKESKQKALNLPNWEKVSEEYMTYFNKILKTGIQ